MIKTTVDTLTKKLRVVTLFSGYDSQALALDRLKNDFPDFNYDLVAWCEIDRHAIAAHNVLFPQWADRNLGDITKVDAKTVPDCDLVTWSFPCQSISTAGHQAGLAEGSGTQSSLAWECIRIFREKRPKWLLMENVKALTQKKFSSDFTRLRDTISELGYTNYYTVLNAKDFGVPQNRERVFMVSILGGHDCFQFPQGFELQKRLKDILEDSVPENYYLSDEKVQGVLEQLARKRSEAKNKGGGDW